MFRRISWVAAILLCVAALLAGCGTKDAESVVKELDKVVTNMESYHGKGTMILHTGQQPLEYQVDVSYQKPQYYRIALTNAKKDITQIVLRNDEGVFVLTPRLNKVFRFQSDWPANQGQVYLYQTLIQSILLDSSRQFAADKDAYVFDVMANYQNGSLARQKIWLNKSDYAPRQVEVSDTNSTVMVEVKFDSFEFDSKLDKSVFDTQRNMGGSGEQPTMAEPEDELGSGTENESATIPGADDSNVEEDDSNVGSHPDDSVDTVPGEDGAAESTDSDTDANASQSNTAGDEEAQESMTPVEENGVQSGTPSDAKASQAGQPFTAMEPSYLPEGVAFKDMQDIKFGNNPAVMIRYTGTYDYTLIQTQPNDVAASMLPGTMVDLGFTVGQISGEEQKTLTWTNDGIEYRLTSGTLPESEMMKVAQSVQGEMSK
ncbi:DUF4367 domain-containing protein [Paenibacillus oenotherae]|uniref:DUF4367 domain-containing protein n=1 Tax=Paenibacillus oenotherae TaxID=1435645 RepID=A0ABS7D912_9BACL|nr:DUF4367 domain-containing protein [Paenibacillus oenotherae]MBW7476432.1 DUF4367 domain-containing protein [Paenibacillus oenotherae]